MPVRGGEMNERIDPETGEVTAIETVANDWLTLMKTGDPVEALVAQRSMVVRTMKTVMRQGITGHYGIIPGAPKPTLLKAGAELLCVLFRLAPHYETMNEEKDGEHVTIRIRCTLIHIPTGQAWGQGIGSCSTKESKYRYRNDKSFEVTDLPIPKDSKEKKAEYRKQGFGMQKVDGTWKWVRFTGDGEKVENPDLADSYNTVDKMASKRALVAAVLNATAASDVFTQDMEDFHPEPYAPPEIQKVESGRSGKDAPKHAPGGQGRPSPPASAPNPEPSSEAAIDRRDYHECPSCHGKGAEGKNTVRINRTTGDAFCWKRAGGCGANFNAKVWEQVSVPGPSSLDPLPKAARHEAPADVVDLTAESDLPF